MATFRASIGLVVAIAACVAGAETAAAADVVRGYGNDEVVLEGKIEAGDCRKLGDFVHQKGGRRVYLASPGGNVLEAMEIGRLVRALKLETVVPGKLASDYLRERGKPIDDLRERRAAQHKLKDYKANFMCASSCFFVFVAGVFRSSDIGDAILGIHRPYLSEDELKALSSDQAITTARQGRTIVESYLKEMGVPANYAEKMFSVGRDDVRWISNDDFEADFQGFIPELKDWADAKVKAGLKELNTIEMSAARMSDTIKREREVLNELTDNAWLQMFGQPRAIDRAQSFCTPRK
jgi:hypothetical protein